MSCEVCGGKGYIAGEPFTVSVGEGGSTSVIVERCDACEKYEGDWEAAYQYAAREGGVMRAVVSYRF